MPDARTKCKTDGCGNLVKVRSKSGTCRSCLTQATLASRPICMDCNIHLSKGAKGNLCAECISMRAKRRVRYCKVCEEPIADRNITGFCLQHLIEDRNKPRPVAIDPSKVKPYAVRDLVEGARVITGITDNTLLTDRFRFTVLIRFAIYHLANPHYSKSHIGRVLGKDHSTICHGQSEAKRLYETDEGFRSLVRRVERETYNITTKRAQLIAAQVERLAA